jgi:hypothetical protein
MGKMRKLQPKRIDNGEQIGRGVEVTGRSEREIDKITAGMLINLHPDLYIDDVTIRPEDDRKIE